MTDFLQSSTCKSGLRQPQLTRPCSCDPWCYKNCAKQRGFHPNVSKGDPVGGLKIKANLEERFGGAAISIKCGAIWRQHMQFGLPDWIVDCRFNNSSHISCCIGNPTICDVLWINYTQPNWTYYVPIVWEGVVEAFVQSHHQLVLNCAETNFEHSQLRATRISRMHFVFCRFPSPAIAEVPETNRLIVNDAPQFSWVHVDEWSLGP